MNKQKKYFYYPCCNEKDCNGVLKIGINDNFTIDYKCDKSKFHKGQNINIKNFQKHYLKKKDSSNLEVANRSTFDNEFSEYCNASKRDIRNKPTNNR